MVRTRLQIFLWSDDLGSCDLLLLLEEAGHEVSRVPLTELDGQDVKSYDLLVVDAGSKNEMGQQLCRAARRRLGEAFVPILYICNDSTPTARLGMLESGANMYLLRPFSPQEFLSQIQAFATIKARHDRLLEKTAEVNRINKRLQNVYQQMNFELELAARIQTSFLPQKLPELPQVRFGVFYKPCGRVGGDFYDVFRLDERHLGFYVADAMGHGVPASLLTIFVKERIRPKEINGHSYRLLPPNEVLDNLNQDMIDQDLSDNPFITMVYAKYNYVDGTLEFSRAGHPHPVLVRPNGSPQLCQVEGTLLGVFRTKYTIQSHRLEPGDKLLICTDGTENASFRDHPKGGASLLACADAHKRLPVQEFVQQVAKDVFGEQTAPDDLTLLVIERVE
ncbi:MAG: SpoIIE family protein phosphatase [Gemmataceae bacterium]